MSEPIKDGGPAFPVEFYVEECAARNSRGMSLRDYFAAKAMCGFLANPTTGTADTETLMQLPAISYQVADALLAEREKGK